MRHVGAVEPRAAQHRRSEIGAAQHGPAHVGILALRPVEIGMAQVAADELRLATARAGEDGALEVGLGEILLVERDAFEICAHPARRAAEVAPVLGNDYFELVRPHGYDYLLQ